MEKVLTAKDMVNPLKQENRLSVAFDTAEWLQSSLELTKELQILATQELEDTDLNAYDISYHYNRAKTFGWVMLDRIVDLAKKANELVKLLSKLI